MLFINFQTALKSQLLKPEMECYKGRSQIHCMQAIKNGLVNSSHILTFLLKSLEYYNFHLF